jgi:hypothetical protein
MSVLLFFKQLFASGVSRLLQCKPEIIAIFDTIKNEIELWN